MSEMTIYDYDEANTIDGSTHWLLIQPGTNSVDYERINRDTLLGITAQPVGTTSSQTLSNKTLGITNTVTLLDSLFTLQDNSDNTKQMAFQLSGITAGNTRTLTVPNASTTIVGTDATQTLTNKTLTSPTITGGTYTNGTISVDAIAEYSSANGVTVDGLNIKDGKLNTNNSVVTANVTDTAITPAKLQAGTGTGWSWQSWTPTWTNLTVSGSTVAGRYIQIGKTVIFRLNVTLAGGNAPSGNVTFTLPVTAASGNLGVDNFYQMGFAQYLDSGVNTYFGTVRLTSTTVAQMLVFNAGSTYLLGSALSSTVPFAWSDGDGFTITAFYEAA